MIPVDPNERLALFLPTLDDGGAERVMLQLAPRQRDIVTAISLDGQSISATAARLSMSEVAVRVALHRALKALAVAWRSATQ